MEQDLELLNRPDLIDCMVQLEPSKAPLCLHGAPGVGKTELIHDLARELNYEARVIHLNQLDPCDLKGTMFPDVATRTTIQFPPAYLPPEDVAGEKPYPKCILFLDEWGTAPEQLRKPALELIQSRKLGEYRLAPQHWVILATNLGTDGVLHEAMDPATADRMCHLYVQPDIRHWRRFHAPRVGIDPRIMAYLAAHEESFHYYDGEKGRMREGTLGRVLPTPRAWTNLSHAIKGKPLHRVLGLISGYVGRDVAKQFLNFTKNELEAHALEELLDAPAKEREARLPTTQARILSLAAALPPIAGQGGERGLAACHVAMLQYLAAKRRSGGGALPAELADLTLGDIAERCLVAPGAGRPGAEECERRVSEGWNPNSLAASYAETLGAHPLYPYAAACIARLGKSWTPPNAKGKAFERNFEKALGEPFETWARRYARGPAPDPLLALTREAGKKSTAEHDGDAG